MSDGNDTNTISVDDTYKPELDEVADKVRNPSPKNPEGNGGNGGIVEKVTEYVPAVGKLLGKENKPQEQTITEKKVGGPPDRPHHDTQIEEFVRDQHRSRPEDAIPE